MEPLSILLTDRAPLKEPRGFTLVEMLVVLAIITIVTTMTLLGHSNFDRSLLITESAYTVALSVREMQTFGLSSRTFGSAANTGYGVHVSASTPTSYIAYADTSPSGATLAHCPTGTAGTPDYKPGNCIYTGADGIVQTYSFSRGFRIADFCGKDTSNVRRCMSDGYLQALDVVFLRPNTDSVISGQRTTAGSPWIELTSAEIDITTADASASRAICISRVGQISVSSSSCP